MNLTAEFSKGTYRLRCWVARGHVIYNVETPRKNASYDYNVGLVAFFSIGGGVLDWKTSASNSPCNGCNQKCQGCVRGLHSCMYSVIWYPSPKKNTHDTISRRFHPTQQIVGTCLRDTHVSCAWSFGASVPHPSVFLSGKLAKRERVIVASKAATRRRVACRDKSPQHFYTSSHDPCGVPKINHDEPLLAHVRVYNYCPCRRDACIHLDGIRMHPHFTQHCHVRPHVNCTNPWNPRAHSDRWAISIQFCAGRFDMAI